MSAAVIDNIAAALVLIALLLAIASTGARVMYLAEHGRHRLTRSSARRARIQLRGDHL